MVKYAPYKCSYVLRITDGHKAHFSLAKHANIANPLLSEWNTTVT